jgi:hypothetical protein
MKALALMFFFALASVASGANGRWHALPTAPIAPDFGMQTSVWTGREMLVFGRDEQTSLDSHGNAYSVGSVGVAAAYDPKTTGWRRLEVPKGTTAEWALSSVWTGREMLVWSHGAHVAYNPATNEWRQLPPSRLLRVHDGFGAVVWTGHEMIGWGGGCCGDAFSDGVAYNPATNRWRALPRAPLPGNQHPLGAWTGERMIVVSNRSAAAYDPARNAWRSVAPMPAPRNGGRAVWDGREVLVVGGATVGFAYNPATNRWRTLPPFAGARSARVAVWAHGTLFVWGSRGGATYSPAANRWTRLPRAPLPARLEPTGVAAGRRVIVWGGSSTKTWGTYDTAGAVYDG